MIKLETAQKMIELGSDLAFIAKATELPIERIKAPQTNLAVL
jgi:hypothetical protein